MKTTYNEPAQPLAGFQAIPGPDDANPPLELLRLELAPKSVSRQRLGTASVLPFLAWSSSVVNAAGVVTPEVARVLTEHASPRQFHVANYSQTFWTPPASSGTLQVQLGWKQEEPSQGSAGFDTRVSLVSSSSFRGWLATPRERIIASNLHLMGDVAGPFALTCCLLAVGILWSEELDANTIVLPTEDLPETDRRFFEDLADATALHLNWTEGATR